MAVLHLREAIGMCSNDRYIAQSSVKIVQGSILLHSKVEHCFLLVRSSARVFAYVLTRANVRFNLKIV